MTLANEMFQLAQQSKIKKEQETVDTSQYWLERNTEEWKTQIAELANNGATETVCFFSGTQNQKSVLLDYLISEGFAVTSENSGYRISWDSNDKKL